MRRVVSDLGEDALARRQEPVARIAAARLVDGQNAVELIHRIQGRTRSKSPGLLTHIGGLR